MSLLLVLGVVCLLFSISLSKQNIYDGPKSGGVRRLLAVSLLFQRVDIELRDLLQG